MRRLLTIANTAKTTPITITFGQHICRTSILSTSATATWRPLLRRCVHNTAAARVDIDSSNEPRLTTPSSSSSSLESQSSSVMATRRRRARTDEQQASVVEAKEKLVAFMATNPSPTDLNEVRHTCSHDYNTC
jgi:hypothetical protein